MAENEFEMIPDEMKEIINTIALADSVKRTIQEKEIDGVEMTKTDKANIIGYLCKYLKLIVNNDTFNDFLFLLN